MKMSRITLGWGAVLLLLFSSGTSSAGDFHVRPDGSDSNCDGSQNIPDDGPGGTSACAWASIQKCASSTSCGDTCLVHAGTYTGCGPVSAGTSLYWENDHDCSAGNEHVIKGAGDGAAVLSGASTCGHAFILENSNYHTIGGTGPNEGFTILGDFTLNESSKMPAGRGSVNTVDPMIGVKILGNAIEGDLDCGAPDWCRDIAIGDTITDLEIAYNSLRVSDARYGLNIQYGSSCSAGCGPFNVRIHNNVFVDESPTVQNALFRCKNVGGMDFYSNYIEHNISGTAGNGAAPIVHIRDSRNVHIYNNFTWARTSPSAIGVYFVQDSDGISGGEQHKFFNNTFYGTGKIMINVGDCEACEVRNNLAYVEQGGSLEEVVRCASSDGTVFSHNAGYNSGMLYNGDGTDGNSCAAACTAPGTVCEGNDLTGDPGLRRTGSKPVPFLTLSGAGIAVDAGSNDPDAPRVDYGGQIRDLVPDIGADEIDQSQGGEVAPPQTLWRGEGDG